MNVRVGERRSAGRHRHRVALLAVAVVLVVYLTASLVWPNVVPRAAVLPKPAAITWYDGCNWHRRSFERSGPFWTPMEDVTTRVCPEGGLPENDR